MRMLGAEVALETLPDVVVSALEVLRPGRLGVAVIGQRVSNMKARPSSIFCGFSSAALARSKVSRSGPCADIMLCSEPPPGTNPSALAS